jgi:hypothetical protein
MSANRLARARVVVLALGALLVGACSAGGNDNAGGGPEGGATDDGGRHADVGAGDDASTDTGGAVPGVCGAANDVAVDVAPTANLCASGKASALSGTGPWTWTCTASSTAQCSAPLLSAFYVATSGSDSNLGTFAAPFATLGKCQAAMQGGTVKICFIRKGSYALPTISACDGTNTCGLNLTSADSNETWSYYLPDGVDSADFTGGSTGTGTGLFFGVYTSNNSNVTMDGLSVHDVQFASFASLGAAAHWTVENSLAFNVYGPPPGPQNSAGIMCYGCSHAVFTHNVIHDIAFFGISTNQVNGDISHLRVTNNVLYDICTGSSDCGALYIDDGSSTATDVQYTNNYVHDGNTHAMLGSNGGSALYFDDCSSNVTATGNVITGRNGSNTIMIHGGSNDAVIGNIVDLASFAQYTAVYQTSMGTGCSDTGPMVGNKLENNIVVSAGGGGGYNLLSGSPTGSPTIKGNAYWNYSGSAISTAGSYSDTDPTKENPQLSCWSYDVPSASPVFGSPVSFPMQPAGWGTPGFWGPPGYAVPTTGTKPSPCP